jgi:hypothetical protein
MYCTPRRKEGQQLTRRQYAQYLAARVGIASFRLKCSGMEAKTRTHGQGRQEWNRGNLNWIVRVCFTVFKYMDQLSRVQGRRERLPAGCEGKLKTETNQRVSITSVTRDGKNDLCVFSVLSSTSHRSHLLTTGSTAGSICKRIPLLPALSAPSPPPFFLSPLLLLQPRTSIAQDDIGTIAAKAQTANVQAEGFGELGFVGDAVSFLIVLQ